MYWAMTPSRASRAEIFAGGNRARLAQNIHRRVQVAFGFAERFLAFHHSGAGHPAQFGNQCRINFSHKESLLVDS